MLSIDFLAGFTIFLLALIVAAGMVPGMLAGLQSATIDYDGVAYRTSVILAEDPGWWFDDFTMTGHSRWEGETVAMDNVKRMGLAVSKETPNVLSMGKIDAFFDDTKYQSDPGFYMSRVFFSDYPYSYNISLKTGDGSIARTLGDPVPEGDHGYIRRVVMVKEASSACLDFSDSSVLNAYTDGSTAPGPTSTFIVRFNITELLATSEAYRVDPFSERINITLENFNKTFYTGAGNANLTDIQFFYGKAGESAAFPVFTFSKVRLYVDTVQKNALPVTVTHNLTLTLDPGFFTGKAPDDKRALTIRDFEFTFANSPGTNTTIENTFTYTPTDKGNVTAPGLKPGVLEVAVW